MRTLKKDMYIYHYIIRNENTSSISHRNKNLGRAVVKDGVWDAKNWNRWRIDEKDREQRGDGLSSRCDDGLIRRNLHEDTRGKSFSKTLRRDRGFINKVVSLGKSSKVIHIDLWAILGP